ncbi:hypothetical protein BRARA_A01296 [Brassica rapa]|uniref:Hydrophobic seed protein domain-containing protein n=1 Tax=Brassica campestris TaxID=3711 RepID=A0A398ALB2_BRACM|nr:hypothetical protein BRARA_A01296 [Brassica rapa]
MAPHCSTKTIVFVLALISIFFLSETEAQEITPPESPPPKISPPQIEPPEITPPKITPPEITPPEITPPEIPPPKISPPQIEPPEITPPEIPPPKISPPDTPPPSGTPPKQSPPLPPPNFQPPPPPLPTCPRNTAQQRACANVVRRYGNFLDFGRAQPCCSLIRDLSDSEAAACLCGFVQPPGQRRSPPPRNIFVLCRACGRRVPRGFMCP